MGIFRWQHRQIRRFFNWGKPAGLPKEMSAGRLVLPRRRATMAKIVLSSPATLTGAEEKKTGPSRFRPDFSILSRLVDCAAFVGSIANVILVYKLLWTEH